MKPNYPKLIFALVIGAYFIRSVWTPEVWRLIDGVDLIFHEAGHFFFSVFPQLWVEMAGGSIFQVLLPLGIAIYAFIRRQPYTGALVLLWVGQSLTNVSVYAGDALTQELDLIGGEHDWNHLLWHFGVLRHTDIIAAIILWSGRAVVALGLALAVVFSIEKNNEPPVPPEFEESPSP